MAGRGRPKKLPNIVEELVNQTLALKNDIEELKDEVREIKNDNIYRDYNIKWDVPIEQEIEYFDPTLSYEISGYRPVDETRGLDFNPEWFIETRRVKERTGKYCAYPPKSKKYVDFWREQVRRCNEGYESHGYRITGDNYFFLNFYKLKSVITEKTGAGRDTIFPEFFSKQYEYFHYIDICEKTRHDVCALKARGVG